MQFVISHGLPPIVINIAPLCGASPFCNYVLVNVANIVIHWRKSGQAITMFRIFGCNFLSKIKRDVFLKSIYLKMRGLSSKGSTGLRLKGEVQTLGWVRARASLDGNEGGLRKSPTIKKALANFLC